MARTTPEKLAQALRANLRRRKAGPAEKPPPELSAETPPETRKAPDSSSEKPRPGPHSEKA